MAKLKYRDWFQLEVESNLAMAIEELFKSKEGLERADISEQLASLSVPPEFEYGQAAFPCFPLAKKLRMAPPKIALALADFISPEKCKYISKVECKAGYINFFVAMAPFSQSLLSGIGTGEFFQSQLIETSAIQKIVVEFSQPNTHKMVHVGHLRNLVLGDSVCYLLEALGHQVVRVTYPGDLGTHIAKVLWYIRKTTGIPDHLENKAAWLGIMYAEAESYLRSHEAEAEKIKFEIGEVLSELQNKSGDMYKLYLETRTWSLNFMQELYAWMDTHFDEWFYESECDEASRQLVRDYFEAGKLAKSEGAIGFDLSDQNLGFALLLKSDGNGLYLTKDLELVRQKFSKLQPDLSILVVDARQKLHFQQLFAVSEILGLANQESSFHLSYESVVEEATGKAISSREKTGLEITVLKEKMIAKVSNDYLSRYVDEWSAVEISKTANKIVRGALKYGMLRIDPGSIIKFSEEKWLALEGDTGPYLQYVYARCQSLLASAPDCWEEDIDFKRLDTIYEGKLIFHLSRFHHNVFQSANQLKPHIMTSYLFELCKLFNRFYRECPVLKAEHEIMKSRVKLVAASSLVLKHGLSLLGIPVTEKM